MEYLSDTQAKMLDLIKKYSPEEYDDLMDSDLAYVLDHMNDLEEKYPTLEQFENEYCKKLVD